MLWEARRRLVSGDVAAVLNSWTVQHLSRPERVRNEAGKYLWKNFPAEGRVSARVSPEVGPSQVQPRDSRWQCAWSRGSRGSLGTRLVRQQEPDCTGLSRTWPGLWLLLGVKF